MSQVMPADEAQIAWDCTFPFEHAKTEISLAPSTTRALADALHPLDDASPLRLALRAVASQEKHTWRELCLLERSLIGIREGVFDAVRQAQGGLHNRRFVSDEFTDVSRSALTMQFFDFLRRNEIAYVLLLQEQHRFMCETAKAVPPDLDSAFVLSQQKAVFFETGHFFNKAVVDDRGRKKMECAPSGLFLVPSEEGNFYLLPDGDHGRYDFPHLASFLLLAQDGTPAPASITYLAQLRFDIYLLAYRLPAFSPERFAHHAVDSWYGKATWLGYGKPDPLLTFSLSLDPEKIEQPTLRLVSGTEEGREKLAKQRALAAAMEQGEIAATAEMVTSFLRSPPSTQSKQDAKEEKDKEG